MPTATKLVNDGNAANTQIIEATVSGDGTSDITLDNDGTLILGNAAHPGSISSDNNLFRTDGSGNVTTHNISATGTLAVTGLTTLNGTLTVSGTQFKKASIFTANGTGSGSITVNHNFGTTPAWVGVVCTSTSSDYSIASADATTLTILDLSGSNPSHFMCIAIG